MRWRYLYPQVAFPYDDLLAENARRTDSSIPSTSSPTPACSTTASGTSPSTTPRRRRTTSCMELRARNAGAAAADAPRAADALVPQHVGVGHHRHGPGDARGERPDRRRPHGGRQPMFLTGDGDYDAAVLRQRDQRRAPLGVAVAQRVSQRTASTTTWSAARRPSIPRRPGRRPRCTTCSTVDAGATRR